VAALVKRTAQETEHREHGKHTDDDFNRQPQIEGPQQLQHTRVGKDHQEHRAIQNAQSTH
jgi:hypothetical protein